MSFQAGPEGLECLNALLLGVAAELVPFDEAQTKLAVEAWSRFGKGRHPARLNLGDCCSYALAKRLAEPLLFKGEDFPRHGYCACALVKSLDMTSGLGKFRNALKLKPTAPLS